MVGGRGSRALWRPAGSLRVEVVGAITPEGDVSLTSEGSVAANIQARSITLAGRVKGDLTAEGNISLPPDSRLDGNIRARNVAVGGVVNGDVVATKRVELGPRARVKGDLTTKTLAIAEGAVLGAELRTLRHRRSAVGTRGHGRSVGPATRKRGHRSDYLLSGVIRCGRSKRASVGTLSPQSSRLRAPDGQVADRCANRPTLVTAPLTLA